MKIFLASLTLSIVLALSAGHVFMPMSMNDMVMKGVGTSGGAIMSFTHCSIDNCLETSSDAMPYGSCLEHCLAASTKHGLPDTLPISQRTAGTILLIGLAVAFFTLLKPRAKKFLHRLAIFKEQLLLQQLATVVLRD